jgi:uncharacterized membrane protein
MSDPRKAAAETTGRRGSRRVRDVGWALSVLLWGIASDARPLLALLSVLAAVAIRTVYVAGMRWGRGRNVFLSPWFFAVAGVCELAWLVGRSFH